MKTMMSRNPALWIAALSLTAIGLLGLLPQGDEPMAGLALLRLGLALVAILALIRAAIPLLQGLNKTGGRQNSRLKMEGAISLGGRLKAAILSVDGREFLVAIGQDRVSLLAELENGEGAESAILHQREESGELLSRLRRIDTV